MTSTAAEPADENGSGQASLALVRDFWLDGSHYTEADWQLAQQITVCAPHIPYLVRTQRALVNRMVRYLLALGVRQFIDLGSGVPAGGQVHEVAQSSVADSRVVYVDADPEIVRISQEILAGQDQVAYLCADIRRPDQLLNEPAVTELIDFNEPVAVLLIETLLHISDAEDPAALVRSYVDRLCSGSYLGISHFSENDRLREGFQLFDQMYGERPEVNLRSPAEIVRFFTGLDLVDPGLVPVPLWQPSSDEEIGLHPEMAQVHAGLARKP